MAEINLEIKSINALGANINLHPIIYLPEKEGENSPKTVNILLVPSVIKLRSCTMIILLTATIVVVTSGAIIPFLRLRILCLLTL